MKNKRGKPLNCCTGRDHVSAPMLLPQGGTLLPFPVCAVCGRLVAGRMSMRGMIAVGIVAVGLITLVLWATLA